MADLTAVYTLTSSGGTVRLNDGTIGNGSRDDLFWIDHIRGLDGATLRNNFKDKPFGDGGLVGRSWKGPRHPAFEGRLIVQSARGTACNAIFVTMEAELRAVLDGALAPTTGTLSWPGASLAFCTEVPVEFDEADNYQTRTFNFGLFSPAADPS